MYPSSREPWVGCFVRDQVEDLRTLGVTVGVLAFDGRDDFTAYGRAARDLRRTLRREPIDIVHAHYGLTGAVAVSQRRVPVVATFHGSDVGDVRWQAAISWFVTRDATPVFVDADAARRLGRPRAAVICAGVDMELFRPRDRAACRRALGWSEDGRYVLLPGARTNPIKRADLFDATLTAARREVSDIVGVSLEGYSRATTALVMNAVDATLMTSDAEGAPVAIKESLSCATPVVSVPVGDVPGLIGALPGCTVAPRVPAELARGVLDAIRSPRRPELRDQVTPFSRPRVAGRTLALYRQVLCRAGRNGQGHRVGRARLGAAPREIAEAAARPATSGHGDGAV
jgi:glycosyltransferase involved in cell wall biosynthesis